MSGTGVATYVNVKEVLGPLAESIIVVAIVIVVIRHSNRGNPRPFTLDPNPKP